jgi:hypothetical protein
MHGRGIHALRWAAPRGGDTRPGMTAGGLRGRDLPHHDRRQELRDTLQTMDMPGPMILTARKPDKSTR